MGDQQSQVDVHIHTDSSVSIERFQRLFWNDPIEPVTLSIKESEIYGDDTGFEMKLEITDFIEREADIPDDVYFVGEICTKIMDKTPCLVQGVDWDVTDDRELEISGIIKD